MDLTLTRYQRLKEDINSAALRYGRDPEEIFLLVVSKLQPWSSLECLYRAGERNFGENRLQEALPKISISPLDISWHFIGTLQKNKVRKAVGRFALIHSVDTPELAAKISRCSEEGNLTSEILLQVNCSGESSKHGLTAEGWNEALEELLTLPAIEIKGLMTIAPKNAEEVDARRYFSKLRSLRDELIITSGGRLSLPHLSMGMSSDYQYAIAEGATILRVGSAIFK